MNKNRSRTFKALFLLKFCLILSACKHEVVLTENTTKFHPPQQCYEVIEMQEVRLSPMLLNKCTGETWITATTQLYDEKGKESGITYRWWRLDKYLGENSFVQPD